MRAQWRHSDEEASPTVLSGYKLCGIYQHVERMRRDIDPIQVDIADPETRNCAQRL